MGRRSLGLALSSLALVAAGLGARCAEGQAGRDPYKVLVVTSTTDAVTHGRHQRDHAAVGADGVVTAPAPADVGAQFTPANLDAYRAVVFLNTGMASPLNDAQRANFETYFKKGGGFVGIGSAVETDPSWSFLTQRARHPLVGPDRRRRPARSRSSTASMMRRRTCRSTGIAPRIGTTSRRTSAACRTCSRPWSRIRSSPQPGRQRARRHRRRHDGRQPPDLLLQGLPGRPLLLHRPRHHRGRVRREPAEAPQGRDRLGRGPERRRRTATAARPCSRTTSRSRSRSSRTSTSRSASISSRTAASSRPTVAAACACTTRRRAPRQLIADLGDTDAAARRCASTPTPRTASTARRWTTNFATNKWVYLYYSPQTVTDVKLSDGTIVTQTTPNTTVPNYGREPDGVGSVRRLLPALALQVRRGRHRRRAWTSSSEQQILRVTNNRQECCHVAGDIDFDKHSNLWLVTGDDTPAAGINANGYGPFKDQLTDEQQTLRATNATGGTFTLTFERPDDGADRRTTRPAPQVDAALEALSNIGADNIQTSGGPANTANAERVLPPRARRRRTRPQITVNGAGLTGTSRCRPWRQRRTGVQEGGWYQRPTGDDRRSTLNTNDLRGKILRIKVKDNITAADANKADYTGTGTGAYTIPAGNLLPAGRLPARPQAHRRKARGLRDGLPQPVPDPGRRERRRLHHRLLAGRQHAAARPRPVRRRPHGDRAQAGQLRLSALLLEQARLLQVELPGVRCRARRPSASRAINPEPYDCANADAPERVALGA